MAWCAGRTAWWSTDDPCLADESSTTVTATTQLSVVHAPPATADKPVDCFYAYPTVSPQTTANADLTIEPAEVKVAEAQASRFSAVCNVWAPMYRQRPSNAPPLSAADEVAAAKVAYDSVATAWHDYLDTTTAASRSSCWATARARPS
jgi:hypothetical protein